MTTGTCGADITFRLEWDGDYNGTLTLEGSGAMDDYHLASLDFRLSPWDFDKDTIVAITIGEGITHIGAFAFNECPDLVTLQLPATLRSIGEAAFAGCGQLILDQLPQGVETVDDTAFEDCPFASFP